jgi:hypothetical protein
MVKGLAVGRPWAPVLVLLLITLSDVGKSFGLLVLSCIINKHHISKIQET